MICLMDQELMPMKSIFTFAIVTGTLVGLALGARADDAGVDGVSGGPEFTHGKHSTIQMVSETVDITIDKSDNYTTDANFLFQNFGPAITVQMGFPESGGGDTGGATSTFCSFRTWVDGQEVKATRHLLNNKDQEVSALWIKTVAFPAHSVRRVRVVYRSEYGGEVGSYLEENVLYTFTGGNWRGSVKSAVLTVHLNRPGTYLLNWDCGKSHPVFRQAGHDFIYTWRNWQAEDDFGFYFVSTLRDFLLQPDDPVVLGGNAPRSFL